MGNFYNQSVISKREMLANRLNSNRQIKFANLLPKSVRVSLEQTGVEQQYACFAHMLKETMVDTNRMGKIVEHLCRMAAAEIAQSRAGNDISYKTIESNVDELQSKGIAFSRIIRELNDDLKAATASFQEIGFILQRYYNIPTDHNGE